MRLTAQGLLCAAHAAVAASPRVSARIASPHIINHFKKKKLVYPELSAGPYGMPALQAKPNLGIAVSGGGYRATTMALGWLRGLHALGVTKNARFLSSNSGGSWFNGAYSYTQQPLDTFLGAYVPPQNLTKAVAQSEADVPMSYARTIARGTIIGGELLVVFCCCFRVEGGGGRQRRVRKRE